MAPYIYIYFFLISRAIFFFIKIINGAIMIIDKLFLFINNKTTETAESPLICNYLFNRHLIYSSAVVYGILQSYR